MNIVHLTTETSGGAGAFAKNVHIAMLSLNFSSYLITREACEARGTIVLNAPTKVERKFRAYKRLFFNALGVLKRDYAVFGLERSAQASPKIIDRLIEVTPDVICFYWVSYFIDVDAYLRIKANFPRAKFVFVCLDEGFMTAGCHYTWGCNEYKEACARCPASNFRYIQAKIENHHLLKYTTFSKLSPFVLYPSSKLADMGRGSSLLKSHNYAVLPLGAVSVEERQEFLRREERALEKRLLLDGNRKIKVLLRSSSEYRKGGDIAIAAFKSIWERAPEVADSFEIISIGDKTLVKSELANYVTLTHMGFLPRDQLIRVYADVDCLLVTSREDSGPIMINECIALGRFVISTPIGVASDLILTEQQGIVVKDLSHEAVKNALLKFHGAVSGQPIESSLPDSLTFEGYARQMLKLFASFNPV